MNLLAPLNRNNAVLWKMGTRVGRFVSPAFLLLIVIVKLRSTWLRWPDVLVDFGRELYTPWQLAEGHVMYRDIAHLKGPLSQYFNAGVFSLLGPSLLSLSITNITITIGVSILLYLVLAKVADSMTGVIGTAVFLLLFAFEQYVGIGNYNFVNPYSHEVIHGLLLAMVLIYVLSGCNAAWPLHRVCSGGLLLGLLLLTTSELVLAGVLTLGSLLIVSAMRQRRWKPRRVEFAALFGACTLLPSFVFLIFLGAEMGGKDAWRGVTMGWNPAMISRASENAFYRHIAGLDALGQNLQAMVREFCGVTLVVALLYSICRLASRHRTSRRQKHLLLFAALTIPILLDQREWVGFGKSLPICVIAIGVWVIPRFLKRAWNDQSVARGSLLYVMWIVFSLAMLIKQFFNSHLYHYGFYLAMPATLCLVTFLVGVLPRHFEHNRAAKVCFRLAMILLVVFEVSHWQQRSRNIYRLKTLPVASGKDHFLAFHPSVDNRGFVVNQFLDWANTEMPREATFTTLPEGVMLNYLTRRSTGCRFVTFMLPELLAYGQKETAKELMDCGPDYIVLVHKNTAEYGVSFFGDSPQYGEGIMDWVRHAYIPVVTFGADPLKTHQFGIEVLQRNGAQTTTGFIRG